SGTGSASTSTAGSTSIETTGSSTCRTTTVLGTRSAGNLGTRSAGNLGTRSASTNTGPGRSGPERRRPVAEAHAAARVISGRPAFGAPGGCG
uniref:hypothetical protein n=1 Tax=Arthrobacter sp. TaxID=1667 RepID=UPI00289E9FE9